MIAKRYIFILLCMVSNRIFAITDTIPVRLDILTFKINPFLSFDDPDLSPNENYPFEYLKNLIHTNSLGVADSLGVKARIDAVVYSKNFSTQGTLIHIIDKDTVGIIAIATPSVLCIGLFVHIGANDQFCYFYRHCESRFIK